MVWRSEDTIQVSLLPPCRPRGLSSDWLAVGVEAGAFPTEHLAGRGLRPFKGLRGTAPGRTLSPLCHGECILANLSFVYKTNIYTCQSQKSSILAFMGFQVLYHKEDIFFSLKICHYFKDANLS